MNNAESERYQIFTDLILSLSRLIQKIKNEEMANFDLKGNQVQCIFILHSAGRDLTMTELCELCHEDKSAMSRTIRELTTRKLVYSIEKADQKYKNPISLTKEGEEFAKFVTERIGSISQLAILGVSNADRTITYSTLSRISDNLERFCENYNQETEKSNQESMKP